MDVVETSGSLHVFPYRKLHSECGLHFERYTVFAADYHNRLIDVMVLLWPFYGSIMNKWEFFKFQTFICQKLD